MIRLEHVGKSFRGKQVLSDVNLHIKAGERVAFVGSNGAGKTTLIRCLLGEYVCEGRIEIDEQNPRQERHAVLKKIGFVPQLPPPLKMPVAHLIEFTAGVCECDAGKIYDVSDQLGLDARAFRRQPFNKLSGGQKQKLLISIALGRDIRFLLLDEPAANLDPDARHVLFRLLAEKQDQVSMVISSHRLDEVSALVNRVVELDRGKIALDDQVTDQTDMTRFLDCHIVLTTSNRAFSGTISDWGFTSFASDTVWSGRVASPDRLRFLSVLSRYSGLLKEIRLLDSTDDGQSAVPESKVNAL